MKTKSRFTVFAIVCAVVCACLFGLAACGNGSDGTDKASKNAEFVEYRNKIVSILKDNGVYVNDFSDGEQAEKEVKNGAAPVGSKHGAEVRQQDGNRNIAEAVSSDGGRTDSIESIISMRDDLFEQSLFSSLYIGDALISYHKRKSFYDIPVKLGFSTRQYAKIVKRDGKDTVYVYSPAGSMFDDKDIYITASVDFKSAEEYSYTFLQFTEDISYALYVHGNSAKEFYCVSYSENDPGNNYLYYAPDNGKGWMSCVLVKECLDGVRAQFDAVNARDVASTEQYKFEITEKQQEELAEKYFGRASKSDGIMFESDEYNINGKRIAMAYHADGEFIVELPADEEYYLLDNFIVRDGADSVKELIIPGNVIGIVKQNDDKEESGNFYVETTAVDFSPVLYRDTAQTYAVFTSVTVRGESPLFASGTGHLRDKSGKIIFVADYPLESYYPELPIVGDVSAYKNLFGKITELDIELSDYYEHDLGFDEKAQVLGFATKRMTELKTINITSSDKIVNIHAEMLELNLTLNKDATVNVSFDCDGLGARIAVDSASSNTLTLNLLKLPVSNMCLVNIYADNDVANNNVSVTVNTDYSQSMYETVYSHCVFADMKNVNYNYGSGGGDGLDGFTVKMLSLNEFDPCLTLLMNDADDGSVIDVPSEYMGVKLTELWLNADDLKDKTVRINLPPADNLPEYQTLRIVLVTRLAPHGGELSDGYYYGAMKNTDVTLCYGATYREFNIKAYVDYNREYEFELSGEFADGEQVLFGEATEARFNAAIVISGKVYRRQCFYGATIVRLDDDWIKDIDISAGFFMAGYSSLELFNDAEGWAVAVPPLNGDIVIEWCNSGPGEETEINVTFEAAGKTHAVKVMSGSNRLDLDGGTHAWLKDIDPDSGYFMWEGLKFELRYEKENIYILECPVYITFDITVKWVQK